MLLITPQEVISHAFSSREVIDISKIRTSKIDIAQEHFIRPRLGDALYDRLLDGEFSDFIDMYIKPPLAYFVRYSSIEELTIELGSNGAVVYTGAKEKSAKTTISTQKKQQESQLSGNKSEDSSETQNKTFATSYDESVTTKDLEITKEDENGRKTHTGTDSFLGKDKTTTTAISIPNSGTVVQDDIDKVNDIDMSDTVVNTVNKNKKVDKEDIKIGSSDDSTKISNTSTLTNLTTSSQTQNVDAQNSSDDQADKTVTSFILATPELIHKLQIRALSDANILLVKALRYIQKHPEVFGDFEVNPSSFYF